MKEIYLYFLLGALIFSLALGDGEVRGNQGVSNYKRTLNIVDGFEYDSGISTVSKSSKKSSKKTSKKSSSGKGGGKGGSRSSSSSSNDGGDEVDVDDNDGGEFESFYCWIFQ